MSQLFWGHIWNQRVEFYGIDRNTFLQFNWCGFELIIILLFAIEALNSTQTFFCSASCSPSCNLHSLFIPTLRFVSHLMSIVEWRCEKAQHNHPDDLPRPKPSSINYTSSGQALFKWADNSLTSLFAHANDSSRFYCCYCWWCWCAPAVIVDVVVITTSSLFLFENPLPSP